MLSDGLAAHGVERSGAIRVHERSRIVNLHLGCYRRDAHRYSEVDRDFGANLDEVAPGSETCGVQSQAINAEG